jgi:16S rRNA (uracil1498-N3)-methyltransferase
VNRFFVPPGTVGDRFPLPPTIAHQVRNVLRLRDGAQLVLLEDDGFETVCRLSGGELEAIERRRSLGEPQHRLTVCQALLKGARLEEVVRQGTEIGVSSFRLVVSERTIVRQLSERRLDRLRAIAREAAEQSERGRIPAVDAPVPFGDVLERASVLLYERHDGLRLSELEPPPSVVIGPEGGFTPDELAAAQQAGMTLAGLGPRILRSESVAPAAAAVILSRTGDFA